MCVCVCVCVCVCARVCVCVCVCVCDNYEDTALCVDVKKKKVYCNVIRFCTSRSLLGPSPISFMQNTLHKSYQYFCMSCRESNDVGAITGLYLKILKTNFNVSPRYSSH